MRRFILFTALCLCASIVNAQQFKTAQGITTIRTYEKEIPQKVKSSKQVKATSASRGFESHVAANSDLMFNDFGNIFGANYTAGYRFNDYLFLGGGVGFSYYSCHWGYTTMYGDDSRYRKSSGYVIPIYAKFRSYFTKTSWKPFFDLSLGMDLCVENFYKNINDHIYSSSSTFPGIHINPALGVSYQLNQKLEIYLSTGFRYFGNDWCGMSINLGFVF